MPVGVVEEDAAAAEVVVDAAGLPIGRVCPDLLRAFADARERAVEFAKFRFKPDWAAYGPRGKDMPSLPDHLDVIDKATADKPFRMVARRARPSIGSEN
jgi:hypothetical protein